MKTQEVENQLTKLNAEIDLLYNKYNKSTGREAYKLGNKLRSKQQLKNALLNK